ncbi:hypothetical protein IKF15_01955 [Candidatus Saccharibacteria bacterium]|nr:hypothetical protein [Candidatus Saccharibacteria bacterium]
MVLAIVLAVLLFCFLVLRKHVGVPFLAMIAGVAVSEAFGEDLAGMVGKVASGVDLELVKDVIYVAVVAVVPFLLYLRSGRSGLFGAMRIIASVAFAIVLTLLIAEPLARWVSFDGLTQQIVAAVKDWRGILMAAGTVLAYIDVFLFRTGKIRS